MAPRIAILCPGQGGQHPGMFDLAITSPAAAAAIRDWRVDTIVGMCLEDLRQAPDAVYRNRVAQPLVVAAGLAIWQAVHGLLPTPALVAGYSVGELTAYAVAGAMPAPEAIRLAADRAALMDACIQPGAPQGMLAVSGLDVQALRSLLPPNALFPAIETGESSFIVGGLLEAIPSLQDKVARSGGLARELSIEVASHTPFMHEAAQKFHEELQRSSLSAPRFPVLSGTGAEAIRRREDALAALASQIEQTIRWDACMDAIAEAGVTAALELGPGAALSRMLRERHPHMESRSVSEFRSFSGLENWIARRM